MVRPIFEYCAVTFHSLLTNEQSEWLDPDAVRIITSEYTCSYSGTLERLGLQTLAETRLIMIDKFISKNLTTHTTLGSGDGFPSRKVRHDYNIRHGEEFVQYKYNNTERARRSPLNFFRQRLNRDC